MTTSLKTYATKGELIEGYAELLSLDGCPIETGRMVARSKIVYAPHISNLGWFIRGFGFSLDRQPINPVFRVEAMR